MSTSAIVRVGFQSDTPANQAANDALVGHTQLPRYTGPFVRVNTAVYECAGKDPNEVLKALTRLLGVYRNHHTTIDFLSITLTDLDRYPDYPNEEE